MPERSDLRANITEPESTQLVFLLDLAENSLDPTSVQCEQAEKQFGILVEQIYTREITVKCIRVSLKEFANRIRVLCFREINKRSADKPSALPPSA